MKGAEDSDTSMTREKSIEPMIRQAEETNQRLGLKDQTATEHQSHSADSLHASTSQQFYN